MFRFTSLTALILSLGYINDTRGAWGTGPSRSTCTVGSKTVKTSPGSLANRNTNQGVSPAITNLMNSIGSAKSNLASAGTFYGGHKGKATEELDKAIKMINIYAPQTKNSTAMGTGKESTSQSQSIDTNASNKKLRQAKQAIDNSIGIMYATKNPSFENQLLVSYFKKASKEIDLALKY